MKYVKFGTTDFYVSQLSLGCMSMSGAYGPADDDESVATLHRAFELGINFIDTSASYGNGHNRDLIRRALQGRRDQVMTGMTDAITPAERSQELSLRGSTIGLDISDHFTSLCVLDSSGEVIEEARLRTIATGFSQRFSSMPPCRVILEVGTHSPWVSRLLLSLGHEVIVANPRRVRLIADSTRKNDRSDAETLAPLGRIDPVP